MPKQRSQSGTSVSNVSKLTRSSSHADTRRGLDRTTSNEISPAEPSAAHKRLSTHASMLEIQDGQKASWNNAKALEAFVPDIVLERIGHLGERGLAANKRSSFHEVACIALADISGFTPLTERMSKLGDEGMEQLSKTLNLYFGKMIDGIYKSSGDVLKFAGDALLFVFRAGTAQATQATGVAGDDDDAADGSPTETSTALAALQSREQEKVLGALVEQCLCCSLHLLTDLDHYEGLRLHIGVGVGSISYLHVGGLR